MYLNDHKLNFNNIFELNFGTIYFVWISILVGGMKSDEGGWLCTIK